MMTMNGCPDYRVTSRQKVQINNPEIQAKVGAVNFYSITVRAFNLGSLEDSCEDYGQVVVYKGSISGSPKTFKLDERYSFNAGEPVRVCGNTASMLRETRFESHFEITGDRSVHYGPFDCAPADESSGACC